ncbi:MAG: phage antirepressor KilAC domain-containing protein [Atopobium minutum]|uniref:Bro-N domain-containing protein n=1 Tax=Atopobium minutum 10063974 TaxID=997872 RepID=N2BJQ2_9ACTN|nr:MULTISPECIES: phage antirepressor KilAC domain-containing protein [Atopobium]EMZ41957.1 hypothetical protein HMPREF1091_00931 [Atopobium minutum 10063974]ERL14271.1 antirepressor protein KilAC domain protein [Atopobium sp. BV3Ac4]MDU4970417.1 phage antirepressor KilAC domain-containing protein [Atopobium minutum]MDU5357775.1 phage antirepressor KilAC domain-containing protein [Atopobium minutum]
MTNLQVFQNSEFGSIRTTTIDGVPYFVGKDVAEVLCYSNPQKAIRDHVDEEDRTVNESFTVNGTMGLLINESGLYSLILSSHMPKAKKFKRWVTAEVLPAIRKHGVYATKELLADPDMLIEALLELKAEREKTKTLKVTTAIQKQQIAELQPKATYCDIVLKCKDAVNISVIAKDYGMSAKRMNKLLHELGIQFKQGNIWLLYQPFAECGYTKTNTTIYEDKEGREHTAVHTKWTQKGRLFIYETLKDRGIYPQIEQEVR